MRIILPLLMTLMVLPAPAFGLSLWPELQFERTLSVHPVSQPTVSAGVQLRMGELADRIAAAGALSLGYSNYAGKGLSWQVGFHGVQGVRGSRHHSQFGHSRTALVWSRSMFSFAGGSDFWIDDGIASWLSSASPWGAIAWHQWPVHGGVSVGWDRSDQVTNVDPLTMWSRSSRPGLNGAVTVGGDVGPLLVAVSYTVQVDDQDIEEILSDAIVADVIYIKQIAIGLVSPYISVRQPVQKGRSRSVVVVDTGIRLDFDIRTVRRSLKSDSNSDAPREQFDPFG